VENTAHIQRIRVAASLEAAEAFAADVSNLPRWTLFFETLLVKTRKNQARFLTRNEQSETMIVVRRKSKTIRIMSILSLLGGRLETANIELSGNGQSTDMTFTIYIPADLPIEKRNKMIADVNTELDRFRGTVEAR